MRAINTQLEELRRAVAKMDRTRGNNALDAVAMIPFRYGINDWFEALYQLEGGQGTTSDVGLAFSTGYQFPASTHANSIGFRGAAYYGWGTARGGYTGPLPAADPLGRVSFRRSMLAFEAGIDAHFSLSRRVQLVARSSLRVGHQTYDTKDVDGPQVDGLLLGVPLSAGVSYRVLPWFMFGLTGGAILDLKHLKPSLAYTGVGGNVTQMDTSFAVVPMGGVHVALGW